jgi:hypothetical protein
MTAYETQVPGAPVWLDIASSDVEKTKAFYGAVFGWDGEPAEEKFHGYFNFGKNGVRIAGAMPTMDPGQPDGWSIYLRTDDAKRTSDQASAHGATTIVDAADVDSLGRMAIMVDPAGAQIGGWEPGDHKGFGLIAEHGAPGWFELHTRDYDGAVEFYRDVFGWTTAPIPGGMRYSVFQVGEEMFGGIMDAAEWLPEGAPSVWKVYFAVDDTDAAVECIKANGGTIQMEPVDTPYGRHAEATDTTGASFKLVGPNDSMPQG